MEDDFETFIAQAHRLRDEHRQLQHRHNVLHNQIEEKQATISQLASDIEARQREQAELQKRMSDIDSRKRLMMAAQTSSAVVATERNETILRKRPLSDDVQLPVLESADMNSPRKLRRRRTDIVIDLEDDPEDHAAASDVGSAIKENSLPEQDFTHSEQSTELTARSTSSGLTSAVADRSHASDLALDVGYKLEQERIELGRQSSIHERFPTVLCIDSVWVEVACAVCGANCGARGFLRNLKGLLVHFVRNHKDVPYHGLDFCTKRIVSEADVEMMKRGEEPSTAIVHRMLPSKKYKRRMGV